MRTHEERNGIRIETDDGDLEGDLVVPIAARGVVLFAHGSGSSRLSPRNQRVAQSLNEHGLATLLMDLLTHEEERIDELTGQIRFDIEHLAARLVAAVDWLDSRPATAALKLGIFGASTGAAAALVCAAAQPHRVHAVVSRGGRPDLAGEALDAVLAPTLLLVGGDDTEVLALNRKALAKLRGPKELRIIPHAGHLFEEKGALEAVARDASDWFHRHLAIGLS